LEDAALFLEDVAGFLEDRGLDFPQPFLCIGAIDSQVDFRAGDFHQAKQITAPILAAVANKEQTSP
jgi:hypothetical protein